MKSDLVEIMQKKGISAIMVYEPNGNLTSKNMKWVTTPDSSMAHPTCAFWKDDGTSAMIHGPMEGEQAAIAGMPLVNSQYIDDQVAFLKDEADRTEEWLRTICKEYGLTEPGKTFEFHTTMDSSKSRHLLIRLRRDLGVPFVNGWSHNSIAAARETKGPKEIEIIRGNAKNSVEVFNETIKYLQSAKCSITGNGTYLIHDDGGSPVTVGYMKSFVRKQLLARGMIDIEPTVFSVGADCADPHGHGTDTDKICYGKTILMDMFPQTINGGYFYDCTRTWWLGKVPEAIQENYDLVAEAQDVVLNEFQPGVLAYTYHDRAAAVLADAGHSVPDKDGRYPEDGFMHSLGHGFGLEIHELPSLSPRNKKSEMKVGHTFTVEPGLYYAEEKYKDAAGITHIGHGIRLEDALHLSEDGPVNMTAGLPKKLRIR